MSSGLASLTGGVAKLLRHYQNKITNIFRVRLVTPQNLKGGTQMREVARVQQGFFPTQDRVVRAVAGLIKLPAAPQGPIVVLDAGCGTGKAIHDLRQQWLAQLSDLNVSLFGVESDKNRCQQAAEMLSTGNVLWSAIEDATVDNPVSLLWFNPPYDRIRGAGRTESTLFNRVKEWPARGTGLMLMIVPDYVLADADVGLAVSVERDYELLGLCRYPEPEYQDFKQCVLLGRRREKALNKTLLTFPRWAAEPTKWPVLRDDMKPVATIQPVQKAVTLRRTRLGNDIIVDAVSRSPLRSGLLREAAAPAPPIGRPLLPLKHGQRRMKNVFDLLIADEVHELAGAETEQGNCFGTLASACRYTMALTGTLISGQARDLHAPLWRMSAELLNQRGFNIQNFKGARVSPIARNERTFVTKYGVMQHEIIRSCRGEADDFTGSIKRGACGR
jgi:hypothetical protein